jgi:fibronectin type 3 domain-containing protein
MHNEERPNKLMAQVFDDDFISSAPLEVLDVASLPSQPMVVSAGPTRSKKMITGIGAFVATTVGKVVRGTAIAAASVGGAHAAGIRRIQSSGGAVSSKSIKAVAAVLLALSLVCTVVAQPAEAQQNTGEADEQAYVNGQRAIDRLGDRLPLVAASYGLNPGQLMRMLQQDQTLFVDLAEELVYFDVLAPGEVISDAAADATSAAPPVTSAEFQLASNPGATKTIFLDFDGQVTQGTTWNSQNSITTIVSPPYDTDGNPDSWSSAELQVIRDSWAVVAEDFAPWDVNVTTIDPGPDALRRSSSGDTQWGVRALITTDNFLSCGCGGVAYIGAFDDTADEPAFVFNTSFVGVSEAISHEVGHTLLLAHDGLNSGTTYYAGHIGAGEPGWAPIMGASYYQPVTQWSQQEYLDANNDDSGANYNNGRDDIAIISSLSNGNGFGLRADDHGDQAANATAITDGSPQIDGLIETRGDRDVFWFVTAGGDIMLAASPALIGANLDIAMTLRDSSGAIVSGDNQIGLLSANISTTVPAGEFTIEISGVGVGSPSTSPATGYTDYGSIGRYTITGTIGGLGSVDTQAPEPPTGLTASVLNSTVSLSWNTNAEPDLASYIVRRATSPGGEFVEIGVTSSTSFADNGAAVGANYYVVAATDISSNVSVDSSAVIATIPEPPATPTLTTVTADASVVGTVAGVYQNTQVRDGITQSVTEVVSGGKPSKRHDLAEHRWSIPAGVGNQTLTVVAAAVDGGDADNGFSIEWSNDATTWIPLATVSQTSPVDQVFPIGAPTGTISVRVIDTNRSSGQRSPDSVNVDLLQVDGDGETIDPGTPTQAVASISTSKQGVRAGRSRGMATVQVNDDFGNPVSGAIVTVQFSGTFSETVTATTNSAGSVTVTTTAAARKPTIDACVVSLIAAGLIYTMGTEAC